MEKKDHVLLGAALTVGAVEGWLDEHVDPETGYVVDDTLAIEGAAADSKATGEAIAAVEAEIPAVDATLTTTGAAADAKKTGDEIADLKSAVQLLEDYISPTIISDPAELQRVVSAGRIRDYLSIGDIVIIPWTDNNPSTPVTYQYPFVVAHIGDVYDQNDVKHENALWLMARYATNIDMVFDAAEAIEATEETFTEGWYYYTKNEDNSYTQATVTYGDAIPAGTTYYHHKLSGATGLLRYGYNRWRYSAYRQWLNSGAAKNANWWTAQHDCDVAPSSTYTNKAGWLNGFTADWLSIIKPVKVQTACNTVTDGGVTDTTYDRFFLPSLEQAYGSPQASGVEGVYWEWWKEATGLESPSNGSSSNTNDARKVPAVNAPAGNAVTCWLRSASRSGTGSAWYVHSAGFLGSSYGAGYNLRGLPACVIY